MQARRGHLHCSIFVHIAFFVAAEKIHFSKWINTDDNVASFQFETLLHIGIQDCIETCKSKKGCKYINYNTQAQTCAFVSVAPDHENPLITEVKTGYVFGNKSEWIMDIYDVCEDCDIHGVCGREDPTGDIYSRCQDSGCRSPEQLPLTVVYGNMFSLGASIKYECTEGYKLILINDWSFPVVEQLFSPKTYISAVCQENGNWLFSKFLCLPAERLNKLKVAIGDSEFGDSEFGLEVTAYLKELIDCDFTFKLDGGINGRFIKLQIEAFETLTLCELEVYAG